MSVRTALAAVLTAALLGGSAAHDELRAESDGAISVAHAAVVASSSVAEAPLARAPLQLRPVSIALPLTAEPPACARPPPAPVAVDAQPLRPDVVTRPSQGPPRAG